MNTDRDANRLRTLFQDVEALPRLPNTAMRLVRAIDDAQVSARQLERIIASDPGLASRVLRVANSALIGCETPVSTIRGAILRVGLNTMRTIAVSLAVSYAAGSGRRPPEFDVRRFSQHSVFVGFLSHLVFLRYQRHAVLKSPWSGEEILAAALLHDLSLAVLAHVAPEIYRRAYLYARRTDTTLTQSLQNIYGVRTGGLTADACQTWNLPSVFTELLRAIDRPLGSSPGAFEAACCVYYADHLAADSEFSLEEWQPNAPIPEDIDALISMDIDERQMVMMAVGNHVQELFGTEIELQSKDAA